MLPLQFVQLKQTSHSYILGMQSSGCETFSLVCVSCSLDLSNTLILCWFLSAFFSFSMRAMCSISLLRLFLCIIYCSQNVWFYRHKKRAEEGTHSTMRWQKWPGRIALRTVWDSDSVFVVVRIRTDHVGKLRDPFLSVLNCLWVQRFPGG